MQTAAKKRLARDVRTSVVTPHPIAHPLFRAIDLLGLHRSTVAAVMNVTPATLSAWAAGHEGFTRAQFRLLLVICREAYEEAQRVIAQARQEKHIEIDRSVSIAVYSMRTKEVLKILESQEKFRGYED